MRPPLPLESLLFLLSRVTTVFEWPFPPLQLITDFLDLLLAACERGHLSTQTDGNLGKRELPLGHFYIPVAPPRAVLVLHIPSPRAWRATSFLLVVDGWWTDHLCAPDWVNPKNSDLCDLNSLCFFDLLLAD